ncbi:sulfatase [Fulvivirgaceae bacterium BMA12]|uniref:Sulfatase n=1 Tax=Agaribacillus aureus TaxID=3051825 RepID=A0ABT8LLW2_9BACT|nr:sulfatase [Fulvivirgaceae bacterium BMA12]
MPTDKLYRSALLLLAVLVTASCQQKEEQPPNVLFIIADDLGWADLGAYGSAFYETPNLDQLAADGILFTNGYANCPVCSPSRASFQTGKYALKTGVTDWIKGRKFFRGPTPNDRWVVPDTKFQLDSEETTLAEALGETGYKTIFAGKWHLGEEEQYWPEKQGYDINIGGWSRGAPLRNRKKGFNGYFSPYGNPRLADGPDGEYLPDRLTAETIQAIKRNKEQPLFICLSYYLVHTPLQSKEQLIEKYINKKYLLGLDTLTEFSHDEPWIKYASVSNGYKERTIQSNPVYAAMVESLDQNIGKVIACLKDQGLYDNTLIVFTSDNGGLSTSEGSSTSNKPLRAGKGWLYEGGIRVPFIIRDPKSTNRGITNSAPVTGADIFPTVLKYVGINASNTEIDGQNLLGQTSETLAQRPIYWHYPHYANQGGNPGSAIRLGDYKLIHDLETGAKELYNLSEDIGEGQNIAGTNQVVQDKLEALLQTWLEENDPKPLMPNPEWNGLDPVVENKSF